MQGADVNAKRNDGYTLLHLAADKRWDDGTTSIIKEFINAGADFNAKNNDGDTPLHLAARSGYGIETIRALVSAGADIETKNNYGNIPYDLCNYALKEDKEVMALLKPNP